MTGDRRTWTRALALLLLTACASEQRDAAGASVREREPLAVGDEQRERLCARDRSDLFVDVFCADPPPQIGSFADLRSALGVQAGTSTTQGFAITGHSTSLVSRSVSAINPRIIFIRSETASTEFLTLAFARGDQLSEAIVRDRFTGELRFYLTTFSLDCNDAEGGCTPGDLLTEAIESDWRDVNAYAEEDLVNTPLDCLVCHQPDGPGGKKILRMQELDPPWNHWFFSLTEGGRALVADYVAAKGDESFAGVRGEDAIDSNPGLLSSILILSGSGEQPNEFPSAEIEREVKESAAQSGGRQPADNSVPGESATWNALYERAKRGDAITVPYHDVKVTDPVKLAQMTAAYTDYREGRLDRADLPDIRDVYPDDPEALAQMGFTTEPGLDGEGVLVQACSQCHNARLDDTVSRSRFDVAELDREARDRALARVRLPDDSPLHMPPPRFRTLSDEARGRLIEFLER